MPGSKNKTLGSQFEGLTVGAEPYEYTVPYESDIQASPSTSSAVACSRVRNSTGPSSIPRLLKLPWS